MNDQEKAEEAFVQTLLGYLVVGAVFAFLIFSANYACNHPAEPYDPEHDYHPHGFTDNF